MQQSKRILVVVKCFQVQFQHFSLFCYCAQKVFESLCRNVAPLFAVSFKAACDNLPSDKGLGEELHARREAAHGKTNSLTSVLAPVQTSADAFFANITAERGMEGLQWPRPGAIPDIFLCGIDELPELAQI